MRSSIGRITLRGAKRFAGTGGVSRATTGAPSAQVFSRDLCSSSAVSTEAKRKQDELEPKEHNHVAGVEVAASKVEPAVEVLTEDPSIPSVEPAVPHSATRTDVSVLASEAPEEAEGDNVVREALEADLPRSPGGAASTTPEALLSTLKSMMERNAVRSAMWTYGNALKAKGAPAVDAQVMKLILPAVGRNSWSDTAEQSLDLALERRYKLGTSSFNCGLHALAKSGRAESVSRIIEGMWSSIDSNPNAGTYNYLIAAYIYGGKVDEAFSVLTEMKKHLIYPTFATYHALITGCLRRRDPRRAYQTLLAVEKQRFDISAMTVAQVLVASANNDDYDHVLHLLSKLEDALPRYAAELHRIAEFRGMYRLNTPERTTKQERDTLRGDPKPELGAISAALHSAFRGGRADIATRAWLLLEEHYPDYQPPLPFWYCLIGAHAGAGEFAKAIDVVGIMREKGLKPSMRDLDLALVRPLAYDVAAIDEQFFRLCDRADGKETESAGQTTGAATAEDSTGSSATDLDQASNGKEATDEDAAAKDLSSDAVSDGKEDDRPSLADALFKVDSSAEMKGSGVLRFQPKTVGIDELNCIIAACSTSQDLDRAFQTYDEVESRFKLDRNIDTYNALLEGCIQTRRLSGGLRVLEEIEAVGLRITGQTVHLAARLMLRGGRSEDVTALLQKVTDKGDVVLLQTFQMVLKQFTRMENTDPAVQVLKLGEGAGHNFRSLTGRFDFEGVKKLHLAAYGEELPVTVSENREHRDRRDGVSQDVHPRTAVEGDFEVEADAEAGSADSGEGVASHADADPASTKE